MRAVRKELYMVKEISNDFISEFSEKARFAHDVGKCINSVNKGVEGISLMLFAKKHQGEIVFQEYLVIQFKGGAISCRNANHNSNMANLQEIGRLVYGGYYSEVDAFNECSETWCPCLIKGNSAEIMEAERLGD